MIESRHTQLECTLLLEMYLSIEKFMVFIKFHKHSKVSARILRFVIRQNEQDWILRCLCKPVMSSGGVRAAFLNKNIRKLMVILLRGSLASTEKNALTAGTLS